MPVEHDNGPETSDAWWSAVLAQPPCVGCIADHTGESIDENPDCPAHGWTEPSEPDYAHCRWFMTRGLPDFFRQPCSMGCLTEPSCETDFDGEAALADGAIDPPFTVAINQDGKSVRWLVEQGDWAKSGESPSMAGADEAARAVLFERIDDAFPF